MNVDAQALGRAVLIEYSRAGRRSNAMTGMSWIKLRSELSPPVFVAVARRLRIRTEIIFFSAQGGGAGRKGGAGLRVELSLRHACKKTV